MIFWRRRILSKKMRSFRLRFIFWDPSSFLFIWNLGIPGLMKGMKVAVVIMVRKSFEFIIALGFILDFGIEALSSFSFSGVFSWVLEL